MGTYWMFIGPSRESPTSFNDFAGTSNYVAFVFLGFPVVFFFAHTVWQIAYSLRREQSTGTLESNFLCPINPKLVVLGRALAFDITSTLSTMIVFLIGWLSLDLGFDMIKTQTMFLVMVRKYVC